MIPIDIKLQTFPYACKAKLQVKLRKHVISVPGCKKRCGSAQNDQCGKRYQRRRPKNDCDGKQQFR